MMKSWVAPASIQRTAKKTRGQSIRSQVPHNSQKLSDRVPHMQCHVLDPCCQFLYGRPPSVRQSHRQACEDSDSSARQGDVPWSIDIFALPALAKLVCPCHITSLCHFFADRLLCKGNPVDQWWFPMEYKSTSLQLKPLFLGRCCHYPCTRDRLCRCDRLCQHQHAAEQLELSRHEAQ